MLANNDYVHVLSFDFSKAFDTVRHASLMSKLAQLALLDGVYDWAVDFFENHAHCTKFDETISAVAVIHASVIQGSALGPAVQHPIPLLRLTCTISTSVIAFLNLQMTHLVIDFCLMHEHVPRRDPNLQAWAADNNLKLNKDKTKDIVFTAGRMRAPPHHTWTSSACPAYESSASS